MDEMNDFVGICTHINGNEGLKKEIVYLLSTCTSRSGKEEATNIMKELLNRALHHCCPNEINQFCQLVTGYFDDVLDRKIKIINSTLNGLANVSMRGRRAHLINKTYDAKTDRDQVFYAIHDKLLAQIREESGDASFTGEVVERCLTILKALSSFANDIPKIIVDDVARMRYENHVQQEADDKLSNDDIFI